MEQDKHIADYKMSDIYEMTNQPSESSPMTEDENNQQSTLCNYDAKFDFVQHQFVIVKEFISSFVIYRYDPNRYSYAYFLIDFFFQNLFF